MEGRSKVKIDEERLWRRIMELSEFTEPDRPWTRLAFSDEHLRGRDWIRTQMGSAGLDVGIDAGGNMVGTRIGRNGRLPSIACGSHSDTVPQGGQIRRRRGPRDSNRNLARAGGQWSRAEPFA